MMTTQLQSPPAAGFSPALEPGLASADTRTLIDQLLEEQAQLGTAVGRFSSWHDTGHHFHERRKAYQDLIPLSRPSPDEQYAFEVDLDVCSGCKACVAACHSLNGLDEHETWRSVGQLHQAGPDHAFQQTVTTACHHCADPACANGCPVLAYEKDEETGIVRHLDDQCIGCQYCILKCPYDVPKFNERLGIVRKCDMCHDRLSAGEAPACVQSCPNQAIRIVKVEHRHIIEASSSPLVPGAFGSSYTLPSTRYVSRREGSSQLQPADHLSLRVEPTHLPLVAMLVLTQSAVGLFAANALGLLTGASPNIFLSDIGCVLAFLGLGASGLHLGRPLQAWRAFLGWRKSWLSREVIAFGLWAPWTALAGLLPWVHAMPFHTLPGLGMIEKIVVTFSASLGILAVCCSAMVYVDTHRSFWSWQMSFGKFFGTAAILGCFSAAAATHDPLWTTAALLVLGAKLVAEACYFQHLKNKDAADPDAKSARVMWRLLKPWTLARFATALVGGLLLFSEPISSVVLVLAGELLERLLFFRAVTAPRMPGVAA
ncbi:MAG: dimethyl sulfoxide reductase anchor subunit [Methylacidiphilales bacterium]|nr:dimethyl sulfoxide reductase anchor subunit [Candidatus Methylacidiphilales bacterium]